MTFRHIHFRGHEHFLVVFNGRWSSKTWRIKRKVRLMCVAERIGSELAHKRSKYIISQSRSGISPSLYFSLSLPLFSFLQRTFFRTNYKAVRERERRRDFLRRRRTDILRLVRHCAFGVQGEVHVAKRARERGCFGCWSESFSRQEQSRILLMIHLYYLWRTSPCTASVREYENFPRSPRTPLPILYPCVPNFYVSIIRPGSVALKAFRLYFP